MAQGVDDLSEVLPAHRNRRDAQTWVYPSEGIANPAVGDVGLWRGRLRGWGEAVETRVGCRGVWNPSLGAINRSVDEVGEGFLHSYLQLMAWLKLRTSSSTSLSV